MKYIVGYPIKQDEEFVDEIIKHEESIAEVYFSWGDLPSGRSTASADTELTAFESQLRMAKDLKRLCDSGIGLNLLFNANCYGKDSQSRAFFNNTGNLVDYIKSEYDLRSVTTASPLIARFIKENFCDIDVRASVNMEIGTIEGISYLSEYFDSFYAKREINRNLPMLKALREWCDQNGKEMYLLANSGCLNNCSAHIFHDNLVAHEKEISAMDNGYQFSGICREFLSKKENRALWLQRTNFIRPEDMALYESLVPAVKLATRVNSSPSRILNAYASRRYIGSVMELLEPNHSGAFYPEYIDNSKFESSFAEHVMHCDKNCNDCGYCKGVMQGACVNLSCSNI